MRHGPLLFCLTTPAKAFRILEIMKKGIPFWSAFFLVSLIFLGLEVLVTRIFSLIIWHNLAYLVISMALLGIGAAGVWDSLFRERKKLINPAALALLCGPALLLVFRIVGSLEFEWGWKGISFLVLSSGLIFIPFFFLGLILVRVFSGQAEMIGRVYALNLVASGAGAILAIALLKPLGMPKALILICLLLGLTGLLFSLGTSKRLAAVALVWIFFSSSGFLWAEDWFKFSITSTKSMGKFQKLWPDFNLEFSRWDPIGRVDAFSSSHSWISSRALERKYFYRGMTTDGTADTALISFKDDLEKTSFFRSSVYGQAFVLFGRPPEKVLVIGVGGAPDVQAGLNARAKQVTGVEVNGTELDAIGIFLPELAHDPRVKLVKSDGRSYVARSRETYDVIQISGVDTLSALQWGAYLHAENYIHTTESYLEYLKHLSPDGILSIGLIEIEPPRNILHACVLLLEAMTRLGIEHPEDKVILIQSQQYIQMLARKKSFEPSEIEKYRAELDRNNPRDPVTFEFRYLFNQVAEMWIRYAPGMGRPDDQFAQFFQAARAGRANDFIKAYPFDIRPVDDNRPFFYKYYHWPFFAFSAQGSAGLILWAQVLEAVVFAGLFMLLPLLWLRKRTGGLTRRIWFFFLIGLGYMMIEIPLIQRFALYLGHPTYALALVLGVLLFFSGLGSWMFHQFPAARSRLIWISVAAIVLISLLSIKLAPGLISLTLLQSFPVRALIAGSWVAALGIFMGIPFPARISALEKARPGLIPWAWAINISASVVSSILAVILAMSLGFNLVSIIACACYLLAAASFLLLKD